MSIIYVTSIGQTAATKRYYWDEAKEHFRYTESVVICGRNLVDQVSRFLDHNANLVIIDHCFHGVDGYVGAVKDIVRQVLSIVDYYNKMGQGIDEIVVNTAGGTEKMSCIIKDALDILYKFKERQDDFPYITHVWGATNGYQSIYTVKPKIDAEEMYEKAANRGKQKVEEPVELPIPETRKPVPVPEVEAALPQDERPSVISSPGAKKRHKPRLPKKPKYDEKTLAVMEEAERARKEKRLQKRAEAEQTRLERHRLHMEETTMSGKIKKAVSGVMDFIFGEDDEDKDEFDNKK
jgi:hypothetical protein